MAKVRPEPWVVTDAFWERVEPLIPQPATRTRRRSYLRKPGGGRKPMHARAVFDAIVYVLRAGCPWKALPRERFGSASAIHKRFLEWEKAGVFRALWHAGLAECDDMEGIAWRWHRIDRALPIASPGRELIVPGSSDGKGHPKHSNGFGRRLWRPAVARRDHGRSK